MMIQGVREDITENGPVNGDQKGKQNLPFITICTKTQDFFP